MNRPQGKQIVHASLDPWSREVSLRLAWERLSGGIDVVTDLLIDYQSKEDVARCGVPPFLSIQSGEAQRLMDELWHCGIRPTEGHGSVGQLAATERHLEDMRTLVFKWADPTPQER
jgi:hypothetical protein